MIWLVSTQSGWRWNLPGTGEMTLRQIRGPSVRVLGVVVALGFCAAALGGPVPAFRAWVAARRRRRAWLPPAHGLCAACTPTPPLRGTSSAGNRANPFAARRSARPAGSHDVIRQLLPAPPMEAAPVQW